MVGGDAAVEPLTFKSEGEGDGGGGVVELVESNSEEFESLG